MTVMTATLEAPKTTGTTVLGRAGCMPCRSTKKFLEKNGVQFTYVDLDESETAMDTIANLGYSSLPVVITGDSHWAGYQPEKLQSLV